MTEELKKLTPEEELKESQVAIPDGTKVIIDGREHEVKTFVSRKFAGDDVVSRTVELKPGSDTVYIGREFINDFNDREYIINLIEGKYEMTPDGQRIPIAVGFKQMCDFSQIFRRYLTTDPTYKQFFDSIVGDKFKKWLDNYRMHPESMDMKLGEKLWIDATLEQIEIKILELQQQLAVNQIDERSYHNAMSLVKDGCRDAIIRYQKGELRIDKDVKKPFSELTEDERRKFMDQVVKDMKENQ